MTFNIFVNLLAYNIFGLFKCVVLFKLVRHTNSLSSEDSWLAEISWTESGVMWDIYSSGSYACSGGFDFKRLCFNVLLPTKVVKICTAGVLFSFSPLGVINHQKIAAFAFRWKLVERRLEQDGWLRGSTTGFLCRVKNNTSSIWHSYVSFYILVSCIVWLCVTEIILS